MRSSPKKNKQPLSTVQSPQRNNGGPLSDDDMDYQDVEESNENDDEDGDSDEDEVCIFPWPALQSPSCTPQEVLEDDDELDELNNEPIEADILSKRTRGVKVDYTSKEALEKAGLDGTESDDDE